MFTLPVKFIKIIIFNDLLALMNYNIYNTVFKIHFFNCRFKYQQGHILNLNKIVK